MWKSERSQDAWEIYALVQVSQAEGVGDAHISVDLRDNITLGELRGMTDVMR